MTYDEALEYIHRINPTFCNPGLERSEALAKALGHPERELKFIHVAGTNGKGSTCCMLASILTEAGYKTGLYTSPYIYRFNERIRVDGVEISDSELAEMTERIKPFAEAMEDKPTEFELITAIAFDYFRKKKCDVVVLEVGLGGRYDATNIIGAPLLSVITGISIDHTAFLGNTERQIAGEKAGIIKSGAPVLFGGDSKDAQEVIMAEASEQGSAYYKTSPSLLKVEKMELGGAVFSYKHRESVELSLLGTYQTRNAITVLDAVDILKERGLTLEEAAVRRGMAKASWRARFEILSKKPTVIFDGAHNAEGVEVAVESIKRYYPGGRVAIISGVLKDKDYRAIAKKISEVAGAVFTVTPDSPRALSAEEYAEVYSGFGISAYKMTDMQSAVEAGYTLAKEKDIPLFSLGSLYTYGEFTDALGEVAKRNKDK